MLSGKILLLYALQLSCDAVSVSKLSSSISVSAPILTNSGLYITSEDDLKLRRGHETSCKGVEHEDPALRNKEKLVAQERLVIPGKERVDGRSRHEQAIAMTTRDRKHAA